MSLKGARVIVTGGAGFLGSHLANRFSALGADVTSLDSKADTSKLDSSVKTVKCDISKKSDIEVNGDVDYIFHLAALAYPKSCDVDPQLAFRTNINGTLNMLLLAKEKGVKKLVFPSSAQLYGRNPSYFPIDEKHPIEFVDNIYNMTKKAGEDLMELFLKNHSVPIVYFRLFNSFGPKQDVEYLLPTIITQAIDKGVVELWNAKPTRDFTYAEDTVEAFVKASESDFTGGPINIGSGNETSVGEIAEQVASTLGVEIKFLNKEVSGSLRMQCNNQKAREVLGWEPKVSFREGLDRTIKWFKSSHPEP